MKPSSEPVQMTFVVRRDGAIVNTTPYTSGPFMSRVIGPPDGPIVFESWRVRSPLIAVHVLPPSVVFQTRCDPTYNVRLSTGEYTIGYVHCQRSLMTADSSPENMRGYGLTSLTSPVRRLSFVRKPPPFAFVPE